MPGFHHYACTRPGCGHYGHSPYTLDRVEWPECRAWPRRHEWGHWLALLLASVGLRKEGWAWLIWKLGLVEVPQCGCEAREAWLNTLGGRFEQQRRDEIH